jgi:hypothetical protein
MARRGFEKEQAAIVNLEFVIQEHITHLHNEPLASLQEINGQNHVAKALLKQLHACLKVPPPQLPSETCSSRAGCAPDAHEQCRVWSRRRWARTVNGTQLRSSNG